MSDLISSLILVLLCLLGAAALFAAMHPDLAALPWAVMAELM